MIVSNRVPAFAQVLALATFACTTIAWADVRERNLGKSVERHVSPYDSATLWVHDEDLFSEDTSDILARVEVDRSDANIVKLRGVVPPIHFASGVADIPASTVRNLRTVLRSLSNRENLRLHLVGHTDTQPLSPSLAAIYEDNAGLSRERAGEVAELFQNSLALPAEAIAYEWVGDSQPIADNRTVAGRAQNRRVEVEVWYDEMEGGTASQDVVIRNETKRVKVCRIDTVCKLSYLTGRHQRSRVQNLIAPLHYDSAGIQVTPAFIEKIRRTLANLNDRSNVQVKFLGHTDAQPLDDRARKIYGDHTNLSKARAWRVALAVQEALGLSGGAVAATGIGHTQPLAGGSTVEGQAMNRRVDVEFWYDDPLQELPNEPQLCPTPPQDSEITVLHQPSSGDLPNLSVGRGDVDLPRGLSSKLVRALAEVAHQPKPRLRFVGFTANARLDRRTAKIYEDDIGLSAARARRAMQRVQTEMGLEDHQVEFEGRGYVHADDVVNAGFVQGADSYVAIQVVYGATARDAVLDGVAIQPLARELQPENPFALNLMRITVDGEPVDDTDRSSADIQRCTDVALQDADIQFVFDNLSVQRRLSVDAHPTRIKSDGPPVQFQMHANYLHFIERSEIRILREGESARDKPSAVVAIGADGRAEWQPRFDELPGSISKLQYVVRAYSAAGSFDESRPQSLWIDRDLGAVADNETAEQQPSHQLWASYGDDALAVQNIRLSSGTVRVKGHGVPADHLVWVAGHQVPVDNNGGFVTEQILPEGTHTVEVAVLNEEGHGELFLRDLSFEPKAWFYVGMADVTLAETRTSGAAARLQGERDLDEALTGRLAFYADGKFGDKWHLTTSVDTEEGALDDLFKDFVDKSPDALLRRIDPAYHYPTFGDDSTVTEHAPTSGKVYLKVRRQDSHALWGNFNVGYNQNELGRVDRGLYGLNVHHEGQAMTSFGERRFAIDGFAAEPGTISARQEFRGTGGSLYFLRHQDLLIGSERAYVEMRNPVSGLITGNLALRPSVDYEIDYLQGTVMLAEPLASTVWDERLVRSGGISGDEAYLVVRYEYTPGFDEVDSVVSGVQAHYWLTDFLKLGTTHSFSELDGANSDLQAGHAVLRKSADTWFKVQSGRMDNPLSDTLISQDGGFAFAAPLSIDPAATPTAKRIDVSIGLHDLFDRADGQLTLYSQDTDGGYLAPGLIVNRDSRHEGGTVSLPIGERLNITLQSDAMTQDDGLATARHELNVGIRMNERWEFSTGVRQDERNDFSATVQPALDLGDRTDAVIQVDYQSIEDWRLYGYVQDTVESSGTREDNGRVGIGGAFQLTEAMSLEAEVSDGDLGAGGRLGSSYRVSDETSLYLNYALENERTDNTWLARSERQGNLVAGVKTRLSDSTSVFVEERYRRGDSLTGSTHATGVSYRPTQHWNMGLTSDIGTLRDRETGLETDRNAVGVRVSYTIGKLSTAAAAEIRYDETQQSDLTSEQRESWLFRTNLKYQSTESIRWLGQLSHSTSDSSQGQFYDGGFTEVSFGFALRPVGHDRFNTLAKYTYFSNVPTVGQVTLKGSASEFIQKSHVAAVDVTYKLTSDWSVGGKYAYRLGEISVNRDDYEWFDNRAHLYVVRTDYRLFEHWEILIEGRQLSMPDFDETRTGGLVTVSRYLGEHLKLGVGYNFTDFSDDLTDLSFDHRGAFLSITGVL